MSPHPSQLGHILGEQQSLLHCICNVAGYSSLEIADGSIDKDRFSI